MNNIAIMLAPITFLIDFFIPLFFGYLFIYLHPISPTIAVPTAGDPLEVIHREFTGVKKPYLFTDLRVI